MGSFSFTRRGVALLLAVVVVLYLTTHLSESTLIASFQADAVHVEDASQGDRETSKQQHLAPSKHGTNRHIGTDDEQDKAPNSGPNDAASDATNARQWLKYFQEPISRPFKNASLLWSSSPGEASSNSPTNSHSSSGGVESYRAHLESQHSPPGYAHSPTMTFSHIYVLSLPSRKDRRERMQKLAKALELDLTFVEAVPASAGFLKWIGERVSEVRQKKKQLLKRVDSNSKFRDPRESDQVGAIGSPWLLAKEDLPGAGNLKDARWGNKDWLSYLDSLNEAQKKALESEEEFDMGKELRDPLEKVERRQINPTILANWYGHIEILKKMMQNNDKSALILEDDVDLEWDLERRWASAHRRLPETWDLVFLGHCWGSELEKPAYLHPNLHPSNRPRCLHGYAASRKGASTLLTRLVDPWMAFQAPIDVAVASVVERGRAQSFSIEPPLIIQSHETLADVKGATSAEWRGVLADSTMERILREEGFELKAPVWDEHNLDPALRYESRQSLTTQGNRPWSSRQGQANKSKNAAAKSGRPLKADPDDLETILGDANGGSTANTGADAPLAAVPPSSREDGVRFHPHAVASPPQEGSDGEKEEGANGEDDSKPRMKAPPKVGTGGKVIQKVTPPKHTAEEGEESADTDKLPAPHKAAGDGPKRIGTGKRPDPKKLQGMMMPGAAPGADHALSNKAPPIVPEVVTDPAAQFAPQAAAIPLLHRKRHFNSHP